MKKTLLLGAFALVGLGAAQAQSKDFYKTSYKSRNSGSFSKNTGILSFGLGFPNHINNKYNNFGGFGPVYAKYEHGIMDEIGLGGYVAAGFGNYFHGANHKINVFGISAAFLGYYHFNKLIPVSKLDVYAGVGVGFRSLAYQAKSGNWEPENRFSALPVFKVGARWYFTQSFGVYAESGYDNMSSVNLGITLRF